jgi:hypothetical protein
MSDKLMLRMCRGGAWLFFLLAVLFSVLGDREHVLMFLGGSAIWIIAVFIMES